MLRLVNAIICEGISVMRPFTLRHVRKHWRSPPQEISVYLEIANPAEAPYDVAFELWRGQELVAASEVEWIPVSTGIEEHTAILAFDDLEPKSHTLVVLLNGDPSARIKLDFGHPQASA